MRMTRTDPLPGQFGIVDAAMLTTVSAKRHVDGRLGIVAHPQQSIFIWDDHANAYSTRLWIDVRIDKCHSPCELTAWQRLNRCFDFLPVTNGGGVFRKEFQHEPDGGKISEFVDLLTFFDVLPFNRAFLNDRTTDWSTQVHPAGRLTGSLELINLGRCHAQLDEPLSGAFVQLSARLNYTLQRG